MPANSCVLMTGYGPFRDVENNISWAAVEHLQATWPAHLPPLEARQMSVSYDEVRRRIPALWSELKPRLVVHVGVDVHSHSLHLETCAHNANYDKLDVNHTICDGADCLAAPDRPKDECIVTGFDLQKVAEQVGAAWKHQLQRTDTLNLKTRDDAGRYLCEFIYYTSLCIDRSRCVFVHVPDFDAPYSVTEMSEILRLIVEALLEQIPSDAMSA